MNQLTLGLDLDPIRNKAGLYWVCPHCVHLPQTSLIWKPPDDNAGVCVYCKRRFEFESAMGKEELAE